MTAVVLPRPVYRVRRLVVVALILAMTAFGFGGLQQAQVGIKHRGNTTPTSSTTTTTIEGT